MKTIIKQFSLAVLAMCFMACSKNKVTQDDLALINGYWEIDKVETPKNQSKQYNVNTTIDFFQIDGNNKGFRKKLIPNFSGKYKGNNHKIQIEIKQLDEKFILINSANKAQEKWEEELIAIDTASLVIKNDRNIIYHYKKHEKFNFE